MISKTKFFNGLSSPEDSLIIGVGADFPAFLFWGRDETDTDGTPLLLATDKVAPLLLLRAKAGFDLELEL